MQKTILSLDASALREFNCNLKIKRIIIEGFREKFPFNDTLYGIAFHAFKRMMYQTNGDFAVAITEANRIFAKPCNIRSRKKHLTEVHLNKTCLDYWQHFLATSKFEVLTIDGKPFVEHDFSITVYDDGELEIRLKGTIDALGKIVNGMYCIMDSKTHSLWSLQNKTKENNTYWQKEIDEYFSQYELSQQLRFYHYIIKLLGKQVPDSELGKITQSQVGAVIEGIFISATQDTKFALSEVFTFSDDDYNEFHGLVCNKVQELVKLFQANRPTPYNIRDGLVTGACSDGKYPCKFWRVCAAKDDRARNFLLTSEYKQVEYDPLKFSKGDL